MWIASVLRPPGFVTGIVKVWWPPTLRTRRSCGSSPVFCSSISTTPAFTDGRESTRWNSSAWTPSRAGVGCQPSAPARTAVRAAGSLDECRPGERPGARDDPARVVAEPLLEQRAVDLAEIGRRPQVAVAVEPVGEAGELADHRSAGPRADQEGRAGRAVVGAVAAVLLAAPAELRPDEGEHPVGEAARLEVALEREQRAGGHIEAVRQRLRLVGVRVVLAGRGDGDATERQLRGEHRRETRELAREPAVDLGVRHQAPVVVAAAVREGQELAAKLVRLRRRLGRLVQAGVGAVG